MNTTEQDQKELIAMKRLLSSIIFTFGAAALLGLAAAQVRADGPAPLPKGPEIKGAPAAVPAVLEAPKAAAPVAAPAAPAAAPVGSVIVAPAEAACCAPACEPCLKKVCVGEQATREKVSRVYGEACEDFCVPKCSLTGGLSLGHKHGGCDDGCCGGGCSDEGCTSCEHHVRTKKFLVVKLKKEQECYNKCHVELQVEEPKCKKSCCTDGGCLPGAGTVGTVTIVETPPAPMPPAEKVPTPRAK
jgi:hypothetical protein